MLRRFLYIAQLQFKVKLSFAQVVVIVSILSDIDTLIFILIIDILFVNKVIYKWPYLYIKIQIHKYHGFQFIIHNSIVNY